MDYNAKYLAMPMRPSLLDIMRKDIEDTDEKWEPPPASLERASTPTMGFSYDYATDEPPDIQCHRRHRCIPALIQNHLNSTRDRVRFCYPRDHARHRFHRPRPQYRKWLSATCPLLRTLLRRSCLRAHPQWILRPLPQLSAQEEVGTRSQTRQTKLDAAEATQAQASHAVWPEQPDHFLQIQRMTRDLHLRDTPEDSFREIQRTVPMYKIDENQNEVRPPGAGIHSQQQDVFFITPQHAGGGAVGASTPVSTVTLGLIHRVDPSLAAQLREDPDSLAVRTTRLRVYSTMRLIRTDMLGQLASLQHWEEAMHAQDGQYTRHIIS